ncbi:CpcT/CpeT family chromophore lyase [Spongiivirga sp. MCCC 1A20706]|uniref:CpcT/CpeT family chromophore lyase n=1 Tax=Spongiivirga sp. MCCC 1A20706 TaxID=3160963 RepID=UPI003977CADA
MLKAGFFISFLIISTVVAGQQARLNSDTEFKERTYSYAERELEYLMEIWHGEYDNVEQLDFDKIADREGDHDRVHSIVKRIKNPAFGVYAVYVETYLNNDPSRLLRQTIYQLSANKNGKIINVKPLHFRSKKPYLALNKEINSLMDKLKPDSPNLEEVCQMVLQREGMDFVMKAVDDKCESTSTKKTKQQVELLINKDNFWFKPIASTEQKSFYQQEKARCFTCMIDFPNKTNGRPTITKYYIDILDQGGFFDFDYPDRRHMVLGMRNTWSFGMQRETFVIFIQEGSQKGKTLVYSWGNPGADRIGFNPGWIRVQCDLTSKKNSKLQRGLRPDS